MKTNVISGAALAAAAVGLALSGAAVTPAQAHSAGHTCSMAKGSCGGKMKCMTKAGVCKHHMHAHKGSCHHKGTCHHKGKASCHHKGHCKSK